LSCCIIICARIRIVLRLEHYHFQHFILQDKKTSNVYFFGDISVFFLLFNSFSFLNWALIDFVIPVFVLCIRDISNIYISEEGAVYTYFFVEKLSTSCFPEKRRIRLLFVERKPSALYFQEGRSLRNVIVRAIDRRLNFFEGRHRRILISFWERKPSTLIFRENPSMCNFTENSSRQILFLENKSSASFFTHLRSRWTFLLRSWGSVIFVYRETNLSKYFVRVLTRLFIFLR
jgi:hypothetical protein